MCAPKMEHTHANTKSKTWLTKSACVFVEVMVRQCLKSNIESCWLVCSVNLKRRRRRKKTHLVVKKWGIEFFACPHLPTNYIGTEFSLGLLSACLKFIDVFTLETCSMFIHMLCVDSKEKKLNMDKSLNVRSVGSLFLSPSLSLIRMKHWFGLPLARAEYMIRKFFGEKHHIIFK